jgi:hypothetical protein
MFKIRKGITIEQFIKLFDSLCLEDKQKLLKELTAIARPDVKLNKEMKNDSNK